MKLSHKIHHKVDSVVDLIDDFTHPIAMSLSFSKTLISEKDLSDEDKHAFRTRFSEIAIPKVNVF